jgi:hypothetical protein
MSSLSRRRRLRVLACLVLFLVFSCEGIEAGGTLSVVRVLHRQLSQTLDETLATSPTLRAIVDELERSDLLIHVTGMGLDARRHLSGTMTFVRAAGGRRFLRITINERLLGDQRAAAIGHELQHALEVARASSVTDQLSLAALYRRIGHETDADPEGSCYETDEAKRVGALILAEIRTAAAMARKSLRSTAAMSGSRY